MAPCLPQAPGTSLLYHSSLSILCGETASPVEDSTMALWRGFVSMICKGYFEKRWAWYPIERLQMELSATTGESTQPAYVSELAGIVYATLFLVAPQFPSI